MSQHQPHKYWKTNLRLIRNFLCIGASISFGAAIALVAVLNHLHFGQLPLGFWVGQQGALIGFIALIFVYASKMDELDQAYLSSTDPLQKSREQDE